MLVEQLADAPVDVGQADLRRGLGTGGDDAAVEGEEAAATTFDDAVAGVRGAGIDAEDDHGLSFCAPGRMPPARARRGPRGIRIARRPFKGAVRLFSIKTFRYVALAEATSFLILLVAAVLKRTADEPGGVEIMGPIHGVLFLAYVVIALSVRGPAGWTGTPDARRARRRRAALRRLRRRPLAGADGAAQDGLTGGAGGRRFALALAPDAGVQSPGPSPPGGDEREHHRHRSPRAAADRDRRPQHPRPRHVRAARAPRRRARAARRRGVQAADPRRRHARRRSCTSSTRSPSSTTGTSRRRGSACGSPTATSTRSRTSATIARTSPARSSPTTATSRRRRRPGRALRAGVLAHRPGRRAPRRARLRPRPRGDAVRRRPARLPPGRRHAGDAVRAGRRAASSSSACGRSPRASCSPTSPTSR